MPHRRPLRVLLPVVVALAACSGAGDGGFTPDTHARPSSFARIQSSILATQCVSCHSAGQASATQSGLVLDPAVAYDNLVDARPANLLAREDGLLRVKPFRPDSSLLYHKLSWAPGHHVRDYGMPMPLGSTTGLSAGQLEYIRRWIEAGAPRSGDVVDTTLLTDRTAQRVPDFTPLPPPASGVQLRIDSFPVRGNFERELFRYRKLDNSADVYVNRIETRVRPGSHHLLLYTFDDSRGPLCALRPAANEMRDIRNADGTMNAIAMLPMACHVFFGGAMVPQSDFRFPDGVALRLPPNTGLDLNTHYVNKTGAEFPGEVQVNLHTVAASQVRTVASPLNLQNTDITVRAHSDTTIRTTFVVSDATMTIITLTSHMHEHGTRFVVRLAGGARDGEVVYDNGDWAHPVVRTFDTPLVLKKGEALVSEVTYHNTTDRVLHFGLTSEDEMGIVFGYYY